MGEESTKEQRLRDFKGFQVTEELAKLGGAKPDWKFMHCLPRKSDEVDDEVSEIPSSFRGFSFSISLKPIPNSKNEDRVCSFDFY